MRRFGACAGVFVVAFLAMVGYCRWWLWLEDTREAEAQAAEAQIDAARSEDGMAGWLVSGAGDGSYNGAYTEAGTHNGQAYYTNAAEDRVLAWNDDDGRWVLHTALPTDFGDGEYWGEDDEPLHGGTRSAQAGAAPAPNLSEIIDDEGESLESPVGVLVNETPEGG